MSLLNEKGEHPHATFDRYRNQPLSRVSAQSYEFDANEQGTSHASPSGLFYECRRRYLIATAALNIESDLTRALRGRDDFDVSVLSEVVYRIQWHLCEAGYLQFELPVLCEWDAYEQQTRHWRAWFFDYVVASSRQYARIEAACMAVCYPLCSSTGSPTEQRLIEELID